jgi:ABC-type polysaccharide/polyol phosphate export permease
VWPVTPPETSRGESRASTGFKTVPSNYPIAVRAVASLSARSHAGGGLPRALTAPLQTVLLVLIALAIGFRFDEGFVQACGVVVTVVAFGLAFTALAGWVGLCVGNPETAQTALLVPVLPLVFASSAFSPVNRLPGFMQPVATWNPVTSAVDLSRSLAIGGPLLVPFVHFALWVTAITVLFTYLGVRRYRRATSGE